MKRAIVLLALVCVGCATAGRISFSSQTPSGWTSAGRVESHRRIHLTFALKQQNVDKLEEIFWAVSDPTSHRYGRHLTVEQIDSLVAPALSTTASVQAWLNSHGIIGIREASSDFLSATVSAAVAEQLLQCEYYYFEHHEMTRDFRIIRAAGNYSLPVESTKKFFSAFETTPSDMRTFSPLLFEEASFLLCCFLAQNTFRCLFGTFRFIFWLMLGSSVHSCAAGRFCWWCVAFPFH